LRLSTAIAPKTGACAGPHACPGTAVRLPFAPPSTGPTGTRFDIGVGINLVRPAEGITIGLSYDADLAEVFLAHNIRVQVCFEF